MTGIEQDFEQLSPIVDDVMQRVRTLRRSTHERAAVSSMLLSRMSASASTIMQEAIFSGETIDPELALKIAKLLTEHSDRALARFEELKSHTEGTVQ